MVPPLASTSKMSNLGHHFGTKATSSPSPRPSAADQLQGGLGAPGRASANLEKECAALTARRPRRAAAAHSCRLC